MKARNFPLLRLPALFVAVVVLFSGLLLPVALRAQANDPYQSHLPDSLKIPILYDTIQDWAALAVSEGIIISWDKPDTPIPPGEQSAAWLFEMNYDSTSSATVRVWNTFTDFRKNTTNVIWLDGWRAFEEIDDMETGPLSAISVTRPFLITPGDTISFFREFTWFDEQSGKRALDNYLCEDTLSFSVEMLDMGDRRIALLDSIMVLRQDTSGVPRLRGDWQIARKVSYIAPSGVTGDVRLRINVSAKGEGDWYFIRKGVPTSQASRRLSNAVYAAFVQAIQQRQ